MNINELLKQNIQTQAEPVRGLPCHLQVLDITTNADKWEEKKVCIMGKTEHDLPTYKTVYQIPFIAYCVPSMQGQTKSAVLDCVLSVFCQELEDAKQSVYKAILALQNTKLNSLVGNQYLPIVSAKCTYKEGVYEKVEEEGRTYQQLIGHKYHFNELLPITEIEK